MLHILRCSPCAGNERLVNFDKLLRKGLCLITNLVLSDIQWTHTSLPVTQRLMPIWHQLQAPSSHYFWICLPSVRPSRRLRYSTVVHGIPHLTAQ